MPIEQREGERLRRSPRAITPTTRRTRSAVRFIRIPSPHGAARRRDRRPAAHRHSAWRRRAIRGRRCRGLHCPVDDQYHSIYQHRSRFRSPSNDRYLGWGGHRDHARYARSPGRTSHDSEASVARSRPSAGSVVMRRSGQAADDFVLLIDDRPLSAGNSGGSEDAAPLVAAGRVNPALTVADDRRGSRATVHRRLRSSPVVDPRARCPTVVAVSTCNRVRCVHHVPHPCPQPVRLPRRLRGRRGGDVRRPIGGARQLFGWFDGRVIHGIDQIDDPVTLDRALQHVGSGHRRRNHGTAQVRAADRRVARRRMARLVGRRTTVPDTGVRHEPSRHPSIEFPNGTASTS